MAVSQQQGQVHSAPGFLGGNLPEGEQTAYREGRDADIPSNEGTVEPTPDHQKGGYDIPPEEKQKPGSSNSSLLEPASDIEKGLPNATGSEKHQTQEVAVEQDPNIVDWDGPDDPAKYAFHESSEIRLSLTVTTVQ